MTFHNTDKSNMIEVQKDIPIPAPKSGRPCVSKYPIREMQVGDSFAIAYSRVGATHAGSFSARLKPKKFASRVLAENGEKVVRIWRIK